MLLYLCALKNLPMATVKVAINGFGRIGRLVYRKIYNMEGIDVVAINDLTSPKVLAHLLKYDSAQGRFDAEVKATEDAITVNGDHLKIYAQKDPAQIPWGIHDVDVVLECTGFFTDKEKAGEFIRGFESDLSLRTIAGKAAKKYITEHTGATDLILEAVQPYIK